MNRPSFVYVTYIATTPEKLWTALTDGKFTQEYWGGRVVESDWKPGSPIFFRTTNGAPDLVRAKVIEIEPPSRLVMSWTHEIAPGEPLPPASRVTFEIDRAGPVNVKLTVVHEEFEPGSEVNEGLRNGWPAILSSLKSLLETGEALDISKRWAKAGN